MDSLTREKPAKIIGTKLSIYAPLCYSLVSFFFFFLRNHDLGLPFHANALPVTEEKKRCFGSGKYLFSPSTPPPPPLNETGLFSPSPQR